MTDMETTRTERLALNTWSLGRMGGGLDEDAFTQDAVLGAGIARLLSVPEAKSFGGSGKARVNSCELGLTFASLSSAP